MAKAFQLKPVINRKNGQINFSLPKKKLSKSLKKKILNLDRLKITIEDF